MSKVIVYASKYGTSEKYANEMGKALGCPVISCRNLSKSISEYKEIIFVAAVHVGKLIGLDKLIAACPAGAVITFVAVGLRDYSLEENRSQIEKNIKTKTAGKPVKAGNIYYLRGSLNKNMPFLVKAMFNQIYKDAKKKVENERNAGDKFIIEAHENPDFFDSQGLEQITDRIKSS